MPIFDESAASGVESGVHPPTISTPTDAEIAAELHDRQEEEDVEAQTAKLQADNVDDDDEDNEKNGKGKKTLWISISCGLITLFVILCAGFWIKQRQQQSSQSSDDDNEKEAPIENQSIVAMGSENLAQPPKSILMKQNQIPKLKKEKVVLFADESSNKSSIDANLNPESGKPLKSGAGSVSTNHAWEEAETGSGESGEKGHVLEPVKTPIYATDPAKLSGASPEDDSSLKAGNVEELSPTHDIASSSLSEQVAEEAKGSVSVSTPGISMDLESQEASNTEAKVAENAHPPPEVGHSSSNQDVEMIEFESKQGGMPSDLPNSLQSEKGSKIVEIGKDESHALSAASVVEVEKEAEPAVLSSAPVSTASAESVEEVDVEKRSRQVREKLLRTISDFKMEELGKILDSKEDSLEVIDGDSPLHFACRKGCIRAVCCKGCQLDRSCGSVEGCHASLCRCVTSQPQELAIQYLLFSFKFDGAERPKNRKQVPCTACPESLQLL